MAFNYEDIVKLSKKEGLPILVSRTVCIDI